MKYKPGEHLGITTELELKKSKKRLIKLAKKEIIEWQKFLKELEK